MTLAWVDAAAGAAHLALLGACHTTPDDGLGDGTLLLFGPGEPGFWAHVTAEPEFHDGKADPLDRWSARVIADLATSLDGQPLFPFGTPLRPFITWALRSGRAHSSPVGLLVHDAAGLMVSYRGAVLIGAHLALPDTPTAPCVTCTEKPCLWACPVGALAGQSYNLADCHGFLDTPAGTDCMTHGCAARRSCPVSQSYGRSSAQSAYHMAQFHPA